MRKAIPDIMRRYYVRRTPTESDYEKRETRSVAKRVNNGSRFLWEHNSRINRLFARSNFMRLIHILRKQSFLLPHFNLLENSLSISIVWSNIFYWHLRNRDYILHSYLKNQFVNSKFKEIKNVKIYVLCIKCIHKIILYKISWVI